MRMRPLGYVYKQIASRPEWLKAPRVVDVYSLSGCVSRYFTDYTNYWKHNGFWLFDSPAAIRTLAADQSISLQGQKLFYYEAYEKEYDGDLNLWRPFNPEASFSTQVQVPIEKTLEGFDVTSFSVHTSPECSPLSCNGCAETVPTNSHCLFNGFEEAKHALETGLFEGCEPGPYRIIAVYSIDDA